MKEVIERINSVRLELGLSQRDLARNSGVSYHIINKWFTRLSEPRFIDVMNVARALNTPIEYFVTGDKRLESCNREVVKQLLEVIKDWPDATIYQVIGVVKMFGQSMAGDGGSKPST